MSSELRAQSSEESRAASIPDSRFEIPAIHDSRVTIHQLNEWGEELGRRLTAPTIITLEGELGTGKTTLAQAICRGVGVLEDVTSPTFALVNEYHAKRATVFHLDLYRLQGPSDLTNLAWDDIVNSAAIVLVEWPDRAGERMPDEATRIRLEYIEGDDDHRRLILP